MTELLQPFRTFPFVASCALCNERKKPRTPMVCLPEDERFPESDPWGCVPCVEADPRFEIATSDAEWLALNRAAFEPLEEPKTEWLERVHEVVDKAHAQNWGGEHHEGFCKACANAYLVAQHAVPDGP